MKQLAALLDAAKPALDLYRKGAALEQCQLLYARTDMLAGMVLPTLRYARMAARLLCAEARRLEAKRKFADAVDCYLDAMAVGRHYGGGRTMIDYLVGVASISVASDAAQIGLIRHAYPAKELRRLGKELAAVDDLPDPVRALRGEKAFGLGTMDDLTRMGPALGFPMWHGVGGDQPSLSPLEKRLTLILLPDRTIKKDMAGFYDRAIAAAGKPYYREAARIDAMKGVKPWNIFAHLLLPALSRMRVNGEQCRTRVLLLRLAVALELYRRETGVYPDSLRWLVQDKYIPAVPTDPFSGRPIRYRLKDGSYTVWSVWDNRKNDGGSIKRTDGRKLSDFGYTSGLPPVKAWP
jgi:hypothetical protein